MCVARASCSDPPAKLTSTIRIVTTPHYGAKQVTGKPYPTSSYYDFDALEIMQNI